ncbi:hypothetical protein GCM10010274_39390 [Streptomyces lavendofoliae]|uniref:Uncharacterized protein n=1 Tax=Streptomyces lavendofoliae TaxID=67314 RepID=A0A918M4Z4_9ACTN|nr:hypothetical protein GCM10010274_39390 [Streptomyces lavendofoliae]
MRAMWNMTEKRRCRTDRETGPGVRRDPLGRRAPSGADGARRWCGPACARSRPGRGAPARALPGPGSEGRAGCRFSATPRQRPSAPDVRPAAVADRGGRTQERAGAVAGRRSDRS